MTEEELERGLHDLYVALAALVTTSQHLETEFYTRVLGGEWTLAETGASFDAVSRIPSPAEFPLTPSAEFDAQCGSTPSRIPSRLVARSPAVSPTGRSGSSIWTPATHI